jgi:tetratricopeptide (TPR) repeat protein
MRKLPLLFAFGLAACHKPAPAGRPKDVCAEVKAQVDCAAVPQNAPPGFSAAANCYDVGNQQYHCGLFEAAEASFNKSALIKADARTFHALGESEFVQEKWLSARDAYRRAVELDPKKRESWVRLAQASVYAKQLADAHQAAARANALDPNRSDADRADADAFAAEGEFAKAVDVLHRAEKHGTPADALAATAQEA